MPRLLRGFAITTAAVALCSCAFRGSVPDGAPPANEVNVRGVSPYLVIPLTGVSPRQLEQERVVGGTIPFFTGSITSPLNGVTYDYKIMGDDPRKSGGTTYVSYVPIMLVIRYPDGTILDPTKPGCGDSVSVEQRLLKGPNFVPTVLISNGVTVGKAQLGDAFQRAEFWKILKGSHYHTVLERARAPVVVHLEAPASSYTISGVCPGASHRVGWFPWDVFLKSLERLSSKYATPAELAILITYNGFEFLPSGGIVAGDHGAFRRSSGIQTFISAAYNDRGTLAASRTIADITATTHEIGELLNDPFAAPNEHTGANPTPAWGHVGQYGYGCTNVLEVGDPLSGTNFKLTHDGYTYHPQELAFFSWFYRTKSWGTGSKYSFKGTFTKPQPTLCF